ncbi:putative leucine-rich repeat domain superfamily [Helianthus annuus]|nr:putative leucine-rich repeat domain superfamily [Helianthus annuus]
MEGLALDMKILREGKYAHKESTFRTDALKNMDELKLLQLKYVELTGSYENFSEKLRWICWIGSHLRTIPRDLYLGNLVALDMSYSCLEIFELPMILQSLEVLNLKDSHNLRCEKLCKISGKIANFSLPDTLQRLFLKDCYIECTDCFPLRFSAQSFLQYLSLGNSLFEFLPNYSHLKSLRVLDLTLCFRLKQLLCLPSTLAELYVYYCVSLEKITFQSYVNSRCKSLAMRDVLVCVKLKASSS